jgi:hypothetical protein
MMRGPGVTCHRDALVFLGHIDVEFQLSLILNAQRSSTSFSHLMNFTASLLLQALSRRRFALCQEAKKRVRRGSSRRLSSLVKEIWKDTNICLLVVLVVVLAKPRLGDHGWYSLVAHAVDLYAA